MQTGLLLHVAEGPVWCDVLVSCTMQLTASALVLRRVPHINIRKASLSPTGLTTDCQKCQLPLAWSPSSVNGVWEQRIRPSSRCTVASATRAVVLNLWC